LPSGWGTVGEVKPRTTAASPSTVRSSGRLRLLLPPLVSAGTSMKRTVAETALRGANNVARRPSRSSGTWATPTCDSRLPGAAVTW